MCIACEMAFWDMMDALEPEARDRILREREQRFACEAADTAEPAPAPSVAPAPAPDDRKP